MQLGIHAAQILGSTGPLFASDSSVGALRTRITYIPSIPAGSVLEGAIEIDTFDGTSIFTDTRSKLGGAYRIQADMQIYNNAIWTLEPGVTLAFAPGAGVQMGAARLDAIGTAAARRSGSRPMEHRRRAPGTGSCSSMPRSTARS